MKLKKVTWDRFCLMIITIAIVSIPLAFIIPGTQAFTFHSKPHFLSERIEVSRDKRLVQGNMAECKPLNSSPHLSEFKAQALTYHFFHNCLTRVAWVIASPLAFSWNFHKFLLTFSGLCTEKKWGNVEKGDKNQGRVHFYTHSWVFMREVKIAGDQVSYLRTRLVLGKCYFHVVSRTTMYLRGYPVPHQVPCMKLETGSNNKKIKIKNTW